MLAVLSKSISRDLQLPVCYIASISSRSPPIRFARFCEFGVFGWRNCIFQKFMANEKGSNVRSMIQTGKSSLLPPKIPFPATTTAYSDYSSNPLLASKVITRSRDFNVSHQRTASESLLIEEQPSWLDDLLNEPDSPVQRRHRRSSSDSFAYMDMTGVSNMDYASAALHDESKFKNAALAQLWGSQILDQHKNIQQSSQDLDPYSYGKQGNTTREWPLTSSIHCGSLPFLRDNRPIDPRKLDPSSLTATDKLYNVDSGLSAKPFPEKKDDAHHMMASENDTKRAKQQFAQRSRVRKLQYIGELERNVQALQAEGSEVSAELDFLNQQNLILSMENKALKQRLESVTQEQLIKRLEHEMLEREIGRLKTLYKQQQQPPLQQQNQKQTHPRQASNDTLKRTNSKDLDSQFANLGLKHKDGGSRTDVVHM